MAFGTLSACLPTYRPLLHYAFGRKSPLTAPTATIVPGQELNTMAQSTRTDLRNTTTSSHPFTRLKELSDLDRQWAPTVPLSNKNYTTTAEQGTLRGENPDLSTNKIKVRTDLEQRSV